VPRHSRKALIRETLARLSFAAFFGASVWGATVVILREVPFYIGTYVQRPLSDWEAAAVTVPSVIVVCLVLNYVGFIAWLLCAKLFLSKAEVSKVAFYHPPTRFDRWLVDSVFPD
jgi:hypothetical protein